MKDRYIDREPSSDYEIINPRLLDFKTIHYSSSEEASIPLPKKPKTLRSIIDVVGQYTKDLALDGEHTVLVSFIGATGRGKNTFGELLDNYLEDLIRKKVSNKIWENYEDLEEVSNPSSSLVWIDWEEIRAVKYYRGEFPDLPNILTPFSNEHLKIIEKEYELDLAQALYDGGVVLATKPAGTYGFIWDRTKKENELSLVDRDFGSETLRKLTNLEPPFSNLNRNNIFYTASIAVIGSPFVTWVLTRYRDALQQVGGDLEAANEIQRAFKKPVFTTLEELADKQEGGSMRGISRTDEGIRRVLEEYWWQGFDFALHPRNLREVLGQIQLSGDDNALLDLENIAVTESVRQEAFEVAKFLSENPTKHLYAEIIRSIVYEYSLSLIYESTDLQVGHFKKGLHLQPLMSTVVRNAPDMNLYKSNIEEIRRILRKYDLI